MNRKFQYYAFISYKHEQKAEGKFAADEKWAHIFKKYLESWKIPTHIPDSERLNDGDLLISPIFRDSENYPSNHDLNELTYKFLSESKTLVVILSREMLEDQLKLRYEDGQNAWIFNEIEYFVDLGNSKDSIILFYVGEDEIDPNALIKDMIDRCEANGVVCKALNYLYQPGKIVKRLRDFKDKGKEINQYATAIIAAGIFNSDPRFFINAYELMERKKEVLSRRGFTTDDGYRYEIMDAESVRLVAVPYVSDVVIPSVVECSGFEFDVIGLGEGPFYGTDLRSVFIPRSVQSIWCETLFGFQEGLETVIVEEGNPKYDSRNGCNAIIETETNCLLYGCNASTIPDGVTCIASRAFDHCTLLESIHIPDSVRKIGSGAFKDCKSLVAITIPDEVTEIGDDAFMGCESLEHVNLPHNLTKIGSGFFHSCYSLESIILPSGLTEVGNNAFASCRSLTEILLPLNVRNIGKWSFHSCGSLETINLPDDIQAIGEGAFSGCDSLKSVKLPTAITSIERNTFENCSSLTSVHLPDSIVSIGEEAFKFCSELVEVNIPDRVVSIGRSAFVDCFSLSAVNIPKGVEIVPYECFCNCYSLEKVELYGVKKIEVRAFGSCRSLKYVEFPNTLTEICIWAFQDCISLISINLPESLHSLPEDVFSDCESLEEIYIPKNLVNIERITFPAGPSLQSIKVSPENPRYDSRENCNAIIETETNRLILTSEMTVIPDSVESIGASSFHESSLSTVRLPDGVREIEDYAFFNSSSLVTIYIPDSVTHIGLNAFENCSSLEEIYFQGTIERWKQLQKGWWWKSEIPGTVVHCSDGDTNI